VKYKHQLEPLYKRITQAIRQVDSKHIVILEGADWANDWSVFTRPFDKNLVYQFHYYCWDTPTKVKSIQQYLDYRARLNRPVWVGETGERDGTIYWATTEYLEANNIGWCFWPWKKLDSGNGPVSVKRPNNWDAVVNYSRGGDKPSPASAQNTFNELLENIRLENCVENQRTISAILRRAPGRIEAENFGRSGPGVSYSVKTKALSKHYRVDEAVPITADGQSRWGSGEFITLATDEWTAYDLYNPKPQNGVIKARVRAKAQPAAAQLTVAGQTFELNMPHNDWTELTLGSTPLAPGVNHLQWKVTRGVVDLDWLDISTEDMTQTSSVNRLGDTHN
jgi:hypothetical protein